MEATMPNRHISPDALANARAVVLDPQLVNLQPALMADAWAMLKEQRGQHVNQRLLQPAHLIGPATTPTGLVASLDQARARTLPTIRAHIAALMAASNQNGAA